MKTRPICLIFIAVVLRQLCVPAMIIYDKEDVLKTGTVYKFKIQPIDPNAPFRGAYVTLRYALNST